MATLATVQDWQGSSESKRVEVLNLLVKTLGGDWTLKKASGIGRADLGCLYHAETKLDFVVVPGGWLRMGLSCDDFFVAACARENVEIFADWNLRGARPTRWVSIRPFLISRTGVLEEDPNEPSSVGTRVATEAYISQVDAIKKRRLDEKGHLNAKELVLPEIEESEGFELRMKLIDGADEDELRSCVPAGFRLVSEAELEWVFREGGATRWMGVSGDIVVTSENRAELLLGTLSNGFGIEGFENLQNICEDGSALYDFVSPADQTAKSTAACSVHIIRSAHTYWQEDECEFTGVHAGSRSSFDEYGDCIVRLAHDIPGVDYTLFSGSPNKPLAEHSLTISALLSDDETRRIHALCALNEMACGQGHDVSDTAEAILEGFSLLDISVLVPVLDWLAKAQYGKDIFKNPPKSADELREAMRRLGREGVSNVVSSKSDVLVELLHHSNSEVGLAASRALAYCSHLRDDSRLALISKFNRDPQPEAHAQLIRLIRLFKE